VGVANNNEEFKRLESVREMRIFQKCLRRGIIVEIEERLRG
jgi:hypothetical protein